MNSFKSMLLVIVLAAASALPLAQAPPPAQVPPPASDTLLALPEGATFIGYVNVTQLVQSPLFDRVINEYSRDLDQLVELIGVDPRRDIREAAFFSVMDGVQLQRGAAVVAGNFERGRIESVLRSQNFEQQEHNGVPMFVSADEKASTTRAVAFFSDQLAAFGDAEGVRMIADARNQQRATANSELLTLASRARPQDSFWVAGKVEKLLPQALGALAPTLNLPIPPVRRFLLSGNLQQDISALLRGEMADPQAARDFENLLRGFLAIVKLQANLGPDIEKVLNSLQIASENEALTINVNIPFSFVTQYFGIR